MEYGVAEIHVTTPRSRQQQKQLYSSSNNSKVLFIFAGFIDASLKKSSNIDS
jgi:hypothetical protein